jgi:hypothetical protein
MAKGLKLKKRTSGGIIQGRQGLVCKIQNLTARIFLGGRTGMLNKITQGLFNKINKAAPWILDPTAAGARVRRGPRRELGSRVHGGPAA